MSPTARRSVALLALAAAVVAVRGPLHRATFALPVSNDDAILLLRGRHVLRGELATTLWNQPYNGALDAYLLAPLLAVLPHHAAYRLYELAWALQLVGLVAGLARRLGGTAASFAGGLLAAWGTPYMALMTATGSPPNFLMPLVTGFPLLVALGTAPVGPRVALGSGVLCGLAVWDWSPFEKQQMSQPSPAGDHQRQQQQHERHDAEVRTRQSSIEMAAQDRGEVEGAEVAAYQLETGVGS